MPRPEPRLDHLHDRRPRGHARPRTRCSSTPPSTATSRSRSSATSPSSARRSAPAACASSRSRASRSCRPAARRRSRTAWSSTPRPSACRHAQQAVVEFLLINHPLDCPVCDKGGECPLQDISFGWGGGRSRFIEPKRHFQKPLAPRPLIAIDRERCILCYRCVRFSPGDLRGLPARPRRSAAPHTYVCDLRRAPLRRAVQRQHHRAVPGGRADLAALPLPRAARGTSRARARSARCARRSATSPSPSATSASCACSARDHAEVDDGWLCDKGRFAYQSIHVDERITQPMMRDGGELRPVSWERALDEAAAALGAREGPRRRARRRRDDQRGGLPPAAPDARGPGLAATSTRAPAARCRSSCTARCARPALQATVADLEFAHAVLVLDCEPVDDMPILDLRIRKGVRRHGVKLGGRHAAARRRWTPTRPSASRFAPGAGEALRRRAAAACAWPARRGRRASRRRRAPSRRRARPRPRCCDGRRGRRRSSTASAWSRAARRARGPRAARRSPSA